MRCSYRKRSRRRPDGRRRHHNSSDVIQPARRRHVQSHWSQHCVEYALAVRGRRAVSSATDLRLRRRRRLLLPCLAVRPPTADTHRLLFRLRASRDPSLVHPAAAHSQLLLRRAADRCRQSVLGMRTPHISTSLRGKLDAHVTFFIFNSVTCSMVAYTQLLMTSYCYCQ